MNSLLERLSARPHLTILLLGLVLLSCGNWLLPLVDRDEPRFAEATREMLERKDFLIPHFNGQYRFDKPPLIYWCQSVCFRVLGESPMAARWPSVLFATATGLLLVAWGNRLGHGRAGFHAALMWLTCLQVMIHGRQAVADMPMVFFVILAAWSAWESTRPEAGRPWFWRSLFGLSLAMGFLAKGPISWLPLGGAWLAMWRRPQGFRPSGVLFLIIFLLSLALVSLWAIPALLATKGDFFRVGIGRHVLYRSFGVMEGHGAKGILGYALTFPLFFITFFLSFMPWAWMVPGVLKRWWAQRHSDFIGWYLLMQAALFFLVFSLVRTKLPHYTLPAFPLIALWLALQSSAIPGFDRRFSRGLACMVGLELMITLGVFALAPDHMISARLWHDVQPQTRPGMRLGAVEFDEPSLVWEFRRGVTNHMEFMPMEKVDAFLTAPGSLILVVPTPLAAGLMSKAGPQTQMIRARGLDVVQFKWRDLTALVRQ